MQYRFFLTLSTLFFLSFNLFAHEMGHGESETWVINNQPVVAEFLKYENGQVFLLDQTHERLSYDLSALSPKHQEVVLKRHKNIVNINHGLQKNGIATNDFYWKLMASFLVLFSVFLVARKRNSIYRLCSALLGIAMVSFIACNNKDTTEDNTPSLSVPSNDVNFLTSIFTKFSQVTTDSDSEWFYIASNGLPAHNMMVGITNWQQQVPIDQNYTGNNTWAIPIQPELADNPLSTQTNLLKGAIAIGVNGIPIFNPLNNRGEDANAIGELDLWGGHCGRADDYHYHLPPTHLQSIVGEGNPIAYAVDGFPIYGETNDELDEYLGKFNADGSYQYHTVPDYPYFIAGMRGKVNLDPNTTAPENQVIPQARTQELRPATSPLPGAEITDFVATSDQSYSLTYKLNGASYIINYSWDASGLYTYEFVNPDGTKTVQTYQR